jgi:hypothetical protein
MNKIISDEEFSRLLKGLANDIIDSHIHYKLYKDLIVANGLNFQIMVQSNTFWSFTLEAHLATSINLLCKVYDTHPNALHLTSWLQAIQNNLHLFNDDNFRKRKKDHIHVNELLKHSRTPDNQTLKEDIHACTKNDPLVKTLRLLRDNIHAHRNAKNTAKAINISDNNPQSFEDYEKLLARSLNILNRYSHLYDASTYSTQVIGHQDYKYVFKCIDEKLKNDELEIENQLLALKKSTLK